MLESNTKDIGNKALNKKIFGHTLTKQRQYHFMKRKLLLTNVGGFLRINWQGILKGASEYICIKTENAGDTQEWVTYQLFLLPSMMLNQQYTLLLFC